jgi:hypothetical protein
VLGRMCLGATWGLSVRQSENVVVVLPDRGGIVLLSGIDLLSTVASV